MNLENNFGRLIGNLHYLLTRELNTRLESAETGITADQFRLMTQLWAKDGQSQQELALRLGRDRASVTRMVDILEKELFLTRIPDKEDRRSNLIYLSSKGKGLRESAGNSAQAVLEKGLHNLDANEQATLNALLRKVIENLKGE